MDEKIHVTPIIINQVRSATLTINLQSIQVINNTIPLLFNDITLTVKHSIIFIMHNGSHRVVLGRENVARAPMEVTAEVLESIC